MFLRLLATLEFTGTFKPRTRDLVAAGFDPAACTDPLYVEDAGAGAYRLLDAPLHAAICAGRFRL